MDIKIKSFDQASATDESIRGGIILKRYISRPLNSCDLRIVCYEEKPRRTYDWFGHSRVEAGP